MLTVNVGHGQRAGSAPASVLRAGTRQGAQRAAGEHRGQLAIVPLSHWVDSLRLPLRYAAYGRSPDRRSPGRGHGQNW